jgi:hypothetical protein
MHDTHVVFPMLCKNMGFFSRNHFYVLQAYRLYSLQLSILDEIFDCVGMYSFGN